MSSVSSIYTIQALRREAAFGTLSTPKGRLRLQFLARDYMKHLHDGVNPKDKEEIEAARLFVKIINNDEAWGLVKQMIPMFQKLSGEISAQPYPLRYILESVKTRIVQQRVDLPSAQQFESFVGWRTTGKLVKYLAYENDEESNALISQQLETNKAVDIIEKVGRKLDAEKSKSASPSSTLLPAHAPDDIPYSRPVLVPLIDDDNDTTIVAASTDESTTKPRVSKSTAATKASPLTTPLNSPNTSHKNALSTEAPDPDVPVAAPKRGTRSRLSATLKNVTRGLRSGSKK